MPQAGRRIATDPRWLEMPLVREWGYRDCHHSTRMGFHRNQGYEITYAAEGEVTWEVEGGRRLRVPGGHVCLTQPRVPHRGEEEVFGPSVLFWLVLDPARRGAARHTPFSREELVALDRRLRQVGNAVAPAHPDLPPLFDSLRRTLDTLAAGGKDPLLLPWTQALVAQILLATIRSFLAPAPSRPGERIRRALEFMDAHADRPLAVREVADRVGLGESRFYALFKEETGQTPADCLQRLRCRKAMEDLRDTDRSVTEIAYARGFSSSQYFAGCFRKYTSLSPTAWRRRYGHAAKGRDPTDTAATSGP